MLKKGTKGQFRSLFLQLRIREKLQSRRNNPRMKLGQKMENPATPENLGFT